MERTTTMICIILAISVMTATAQILAPVYRSEQRVKKEVVADVAPQYKTYTTKTVYGFLDFTTTVQDTVMVFTPQSTKSNKKETLINPVSTQSPQISQQGGHRFSGREISPKSTIALETLFTELPQLKQRTKKLKSKISKATINEGRELGHVQKNRLRKLQHQRERPQEIERFSSKTNRPFRHRVGTSGSRPDVIFYNERKRQKPPTNKVGSTIVPITIEGTGKIPFRPTITLESSFSAPPEVTITAAQGFASLSVVERSSKIKNNVDDQYDYSDTPSENDYMYDIDSTKVINGMDKTDLPTGLVTTLGGTIISDGLTTVHETNVYGTFIGSKYAQILQSTSLIYQVTPVANNNLNSPSVGYETVKSIIEGSATQFITPNAASSLPLESLFTTSSQKPRVARLEGNRLAKRRGADFRRSEFRNDPPLDEGDDYDLHRSGTELRPSFRNIASSARKPKDRLTPTTYRRHSTNRADAPKRWRITETKVNTKSQIHPALNKPSLNNDLYDLEESASEQTPIIDNLEETVRVETNYLGDASTRWQETATIRSLHTFNFGNTENTRFVTFTKTFTRSIAPTGVQSSLNTIDDLLGEEPLFENILGDGSDITTLPPIDITENEATALLSTLTDTFSTTETMFKTSVLPIISAGETAHYTMTQTYKITRVVTATKTMPPVEAFTFIPENALNEFNDKLVAEGTENDAFENGEVRVAPPKDFIPNEPSLSDLAGGKFNIDSFDQKMHPQLAAAIQSSNVKQSVPLAPVHPQSSLLSFPTSSPALPTPGLSPEQLQQLAYINLMNNPLAAAALGAFSPFQQAQPQPFPQPPLLQPNIRLITHPVTITTDITTTTTRHLRVIFNARPIITTITNTDVIHTTITTHKIETMTVPAASPFGGFGLQGPPPFFGAG